jgi:putative transposase
MVRSVRDWPWSSYRATAAQAEVPEFLTVDWILLQFDPDRERAVHAYRQFVRQGRGINVWEELQAGAFLGTDAFLDQLSPLLKERPLDPDYRKRERFAARPSLKELFADVSDKTTRNERIYQAVRVHRYTLRDVANFVGLFYSSISTIAKHVREATQSEE